MVLIIALLSRFEIALLIAIASGVARSMWVVALTSVTDKAVGITSRIILFSRGFSLCEFQMNKLAVFIVAGVHRN